MFPRRRALAGALAGLSLLCTIALAWSVVEYRAHLPFLGQRLAGLQGRDFGVNMAGAEFGWTEIRCALDPATGRLAVTAAGIEDTQPREPGQPSHYIYPANPDDYRYFAAAGMNLVRLPVRWERLQRRWMAPLHADDVAGVRRALDAAHAANLRVLLDLHNFGRYCEVPLAITDTVGFADVWGRLAQAFGGHPAIYGYELMNEPHDLPGGDITWNALSQAATDAIRRHDRRSWVLVPGYGWSNPAAWPSNNAALNVTDPTGRLLYAAHLYLDADNSGRYVRGYDADGATPQTGLEKLRPFLAWLSERNAVGMVTEYGVPRDDPRWLVALDRVLHAISNDPRLQGGGLLGSRALVARKRPAGNHALPGRA